MSSFPPKSSFLYLLAFEVGGVGPDGLQERTFFGCRKFFTRKIKSVIVSLGLIENDTKLDVRPRQSIYGEAEKYLITAPTQIVTKIRKMTTLGKRSTRSNFMHHAMNFIAPLLRVFPASGFLGLEACSALGLSRG